MNKKTISAFLVSGMVFSLLMTGCETSDHSSKVTITNRPVVTATDDADTAETAAPAEPAPEETAPQAEAAPAETSGQQEPEPTEAAPQQEPEPTEAAPQQPAPTEAAPQAEAAPAEASGQQAAAPAETAPQTEAAPAEPAPAESVPQEDPLQAEAPAQAEETAETAENAAGVNTALYDAYRTDLRGHEFQILDYNWQKGDGEFHYPAGSDPDALRPVALADIRGDEDPELIYMLADSSMGSADLRIAGMENGAVTELSYFPHWDVNAASGTDFCLFQIAGEKTLYAVSYIGDETGFYSWYAFRDEGGTLLTVDKIASADIQYSGQSPNLYTVNGEPVFEEDYNAFTSDLVSRAVTNVLFSARTDWESFFARLYSLPSPSMSYDAAVSLLGSYEVIVPSDTGIVYETGESTDAESESEDYVAEENSGDGQIFYDSSERLLSESEVAALTPDQVQTAVNEIYARHGYAFQTPEIREHFEQYSWYHPENTDMNTVTGQFNSTEAANVMLLTSYL